MTSVQKFIYINGTGNTVSITLEPWAERFQVGSGQRVEIKIFSERMTEPVEFEQLPTGAVIYGQEGCIISLSSNGVELLPVVS